MKDVLIIGSGPAGYVAAIRCAQNGLDTAIIESKAEFGGTCLNVGCIPSKALLDSSNKYYQAKEHFSEHGISFTEQSFDLGTMMTRKDDVIKKLTNGISGLLKGNKIETINGTGKIISKHQVEVTQSEDTIILDAKNIILATGSKPIELPFARWSKNIVSSTGALNFIEVPKKLGIIGAGIIGLELGSVWSRLGSEVVILEALDEFLPSADHQIAKEVQKEFTKQGLNINLGCKVQDTIDSKDSVLVKFVSDGEDHELDFDKLIVAVGRTPNSQNIFDSSVEISIDSKGLVDVDQYCRTNIDNIWAIGDLVRGPMLAHKGSEEGVMVADRIIGKKTEMSYEHVPSVIYTHPEVAWVGKNEQEVKTENISYKTGVFPFAASGRALAASDSKGFVKMIANESDDTIIGIHAFGPSAAEIVQQGLIAMEFSSSAEDLALTIFSHPTVSEALHEAALSVNNQAIHIGNKKR